MVYPIVAISWPLNSVTLSQKWNHVSQFPPLSHANKPHRLVMMIKVETGAWMHLAQDLAKVAPPPWASGLSFLSQETLESYEDLAVLLLLPAPTAATQWSRDGKMLCSNRCHCSQPTVSFPDRVLICSSVVNVDFLHILISVGISALGWQALWAGFDIQPYRVWTAPILSQFWKGALCQGFIKLHCTAPS